MKIALMRRYDLTEDGYRRKFRTSKPEIDESPDQFIVRLSTYLIRWLELSKIEKSLDGLKNLIVKEQFINSCPKELTVHLREHAPETLEEMAKIADQYLEAHGKHIFSTGRNKGQSKNGSPMPRNQVSAGCLVQSSPPQATAEDIQSFIEGDQLLLACGKKIPLLSSACVQPLSGARSKMPVVKGKIGD